MNKSIIFISFVCLNIYSQGWVQLNSGSSSMLQSIHFTDDNTGYVVGNSPDVILKTTDAGLNWVNLPAPGGQYLRSVYFINSSTGFITAHSAIILKTTNGGINWVVKNSGGSSFLTTILFIDASTGFAFGGNPGIVLKTTNQGENWSTDTTNENAFFGTYFRNSLTAFSAVNDGLFKTTNGGVNWSYQIQFIYPLDVHFSGDTGAAVGSSGTIYVTSNGGANWVPRGSGNLNTLNSVYFADNDTAYVVGNSNTVARSVNGGTSWSLQVTGSSHSWNSVFFRNAKTGYAAGSEGAIIKTTSGGITPVHQISSNIPRETGINPNYPNPFNPSTVISFQLSINSHVLLKIFDSIGREAAVLVNEQLKPGNYEVEWNASSFSSGIYFCRMEANGPGHVQKLVLMK